LILATSLRYLAEKSQTPYTTLSSKDSTLRKQTLDGTNPSITLAHIKDPTTSTQSHSSSLVSSKFFFAFAFASGSSSPSSAAVAGPAPP